MNHNEKREQLRQVVLNVSLKFGQGRSSSNTTYDWMIDCREVMLDPDVALIIAELLFDKVRALGVHQVAGMTLAADPLVSYLVLMGAMNNYPINGLIVRKEQKETGMQRQVEGALLPGEPTVVVDDFVHSGGSVGRVADVLRKHSIPVKAVVSIILSSKGEYALRQKGYHAHGLFSLEDIHIHNPKPRVQHTTLWSFDSINTWATCIPHSSPLVYKKSLLFGTNEGKFYSVDGKTGKKNWVFERDIAVAKGILSSPALAARERVIFGAYDGYLYCLDAGSGKVVWEKQLANWIGSSPCVHGDKCFIGLEFQGYKGCLSAVSIKDGTLLWSFFAKNLIHCSPAVDKKRHIVIIGANDGFVYAVNSTNGKPLWEYKVGKEIKAGFAIDEDKGWCYFGAFDGVMYCMETSTGAMIWKRKIASSIYNNPEIVGTMLVTGTVSSRVFALDRFSGDILWFYTTEGVIFSYTTTREDTVYCGDTAGYLYALDMHSGSEKLKSYLGFPILTKPVVHADGSCVVGGKGRMEKVKR